MAMKRRLSRRCHLRMIGRTERRPAGMGAVPRRSASTARSRPTPSPPCWRARSRTARCSAPPGAAFASTSGMGPDSLRAQVAVGAGAGGGRSRPARCPGPRRQHHLRLCERHAAVTCIRQGKEVERVASDNLVIVAFDMPAPQVKTHGVAFNMTQGPDGTWRSIESRDLYRLQNELGGIYHQALACDIVQHGYIVSFAPDGTFKVDGVPLDVRQGFSGRYAQIEAALDAHGQTRATATARRRPLSHSTPARPERPSTSASSLPHGAPAPTNSASART